MELNETVCTMKVNYIDSKFPVHWQKMSQPTGTDAIEFPLDFGCLRQQKSAADSIVFSEVQQSRAELQAMSRLLH